MKIATSALLLVLAAGVALAQAPAAQKSGRARKPAGAEAQEADRWPLRSVVVKGSKLFQAAQLMALTGLKLETPVGKEDFDKARDRLYETGCFDAVAPPTRSEEHKSELQS